MATTHKDVLTTELGGPDPKKRLAALWELQTLYKRGVIDAPVSARNVNNHIHTIYSFSPYSPTQAAYEAWLAGLETAGIMDHDSVAGAGEFIEAGRILGLAVTVGFECRCKMDKTPFAGRRINNPDQDSVAYVAAHGIPHQNIEKAQEWLSVYRERRNARNRKMVINIMKLLDGTGVTLDYDSDVVPLSRIAEGGSITERHILFALAHNITKKLGRGEAVMDFLEDDLGIYIEGKNRSVLSDSADSMYEYHLLGVLKAHMVDRFYINADDECPDVSEFIAFTREIGAISAYAYLGDVECSVTGDKKSQRFEDDYLDSLVEFLASIGFNAVTYMPARNSQKQLDRVIELCGKNGLFQISGEDINSPFQPFVCEALKKEQFRHLFDSTWALIGHEIIAGSHIENGMFTSKTIAKMPELSKRVEHFSRYGREAYGIK